MSKKRTTGIRDGLIGAGNKFKPIKDKNGVTNYAKSVIRQSGTPSPKLTKHISRTPVSPPPPPPPAAAKMSFKASAKMKTPPMEKANVKTTVRFKGLQKMKNKIAKSAPTKIQPAKAKTVKRKPPTKGR